MALGKWDMFGIVSGPLGDVALFLQGRILMREQTTCNIKPGVSSRRIVYVWIIDLFRNGVAALPLPHFRSPYGLKPIL